jgi:hypothetical protein
VSTIKQMGSQAGDVERAVSRHAAFWENRASGGPLVAWWRWPGNPILDFDLGLPDGDGELTPDMLHVDRLLPQFETRFIEGGGPLDGDLFWQCLPTRFMPWLEAIVGCPIHFENSTTSKGVFAKAFIRDWNDAPEIPDLATNAWYLKLVEFVTALVDLSGGRFPVTAPQLRGPWDIMSSARGMSDLFLELYDSPSVVMTWAERYAQLWIEVTRRCEGLIPRWQDGYVGFFGIWAPEYSPMAQDDTSSSVSARQYADIMLRADRATAAPWRHHMFHTHSGGSHLLDDMTDFLDGGRALNIVMDPNGPTVADLLPVMRRIQEREVPLHVLAATWEDVDLICSNLSDASLAITCLAGPRPSA